LGLLDRTEASTKPDAMYERQEALRSSIAADGIRIKHSILTEKQTCALQQYVMDLP